MIPLIDADILLYEVGYGAEYKREVPSDWDHVQEMVDLLIAKICNAVEATSPPVLFLSGKTNFRDDIAVKKGYKANRKDKPKPFHYKNLKAYLQFAYNTVLTDGIEADDAMAMYLTANKGKAVICSRDKDLRQVPGHHYSWECGKQGEIPMFEVDELGEFWTKKLPKELKGTGLRFFYAQCLMGDGMDNIPGLPGIGPKYTYDLLGEATSKEELEAIVLQQYEEKYAEKGREELLEQARLVWMVREIDMEGKPKMWDFNYGQ